ncbi:MAG TPA: carboxylesterase family protein [Rhizomicrobium sp.]|jgi:para-nitrobenzyl esterase
MHRTAIVSLSILALTVLAGAAPLHTPIVTIDTGALAGARAGDIVVYRDIPYAAPPIGALRWRAPHPAAAWSGVRDASKFGPSCPQASPGDKSDILTYGGAPEPTSEDCLTLNIWAPEHIGKRAPVMVWLHGGAGRIGSGALPYYDGRSFALDGVVLVTVNYRLGNLGGFAYPGLSAEAKAHGEPVGAYGMMDQIAALKWVKRNIAAFGGDPGNVTIFGESSGGISVFNMLVTPSTWGLFKKAIVESGGGWFGPPPSAADAEKRGAEIAKAAGAPAGASLSTLRAMPTSAFTHVPGDNVAEPDPDLVPDGITVAIAGGHVAPVPLIIGVNDGEDSLIDRAIAKATAGMDDSTLAKMRELYGKQIDREMAARLQFRDMLGTAPARWVAARWPAPAYLYRFEHVTESYRPARPRAHHGAEIFYVFKTLGREPDVASHPVKNDEELAEQIHARWVAFARSGVPDVGGSAPWPVYQASQDRWMVFGQEHTAVQTGVLKTQLDYDEAKTRWLILLVRLQRGIAHFFSWF